MQVQGWDSPTSKFKYEQQKSVVLSLQTIIAAFTGRVVLSKTQWNSPKLQWAKLLQMEREYIRSTMARPLFHGIPEGDKEKWTWQTYQCVDDQQHFNVYKTCEELAA